MANTAATSPGTIASVQQSGTDHDWINDHNNVKVADGVFDRSNIDDGDASFFLKCTNFGFSIPTGATIDGILAEVKGKISSGSNEWNRCCIVKGGTINTGTTRSATAGSLTTTNAYSSIGSSSDLWGQTFLYSDINDSGFGVAIRTIDDTGGKSYDIDHVQITVYYTEISGPANVKTFQGVAKASVKTVQGVAIASVKTSQGVA